MSSMCVKSVKSFAVVDVVEVGAAVFGAAIGGSGRSIGGRLCRRTASLQEATTAKVDWKTKVANGVACGEKRDARSERVRKSGHNPVKRYPIFGRLIGFDRF